MPCPWNTARRKSLPYICNFMKKKQIYLLSFLLLLGAGGILYLTLKPDYEYRAVTAPATTVRFEKDTLHLGTLSYNTEREAAFRFTNTGNVPLLIRDIRTTCGCTSVSWDKRPVLPGDSGEIKVIFKPNSLGAFFKTIEVIANIPGNVIPLKIRGQVIE